MKKKKLIKHNTLPVKIMFKLLYGEEGIQERRVGPDFVEVTLYSGPLAKALYVSISTLFSQIAYLKVLGLILRTEQIKRGHYIIRVKPYADLDKVE